MSHSNTNYMKVVLVQVSVLVGRKTLFLYNLHDPENPVELAFQQRYGSVVTYKWCVCTLGINITCLYRVSYSYPDWFLMALIISYNKTYLSVFITSGLSISKHFIEAP